jgi:hypothetical protein
LPESSQSEPKTKLTVELCPSLIEQAGHFLEENEKLTMDELVSKALAEFLQKVGKGRSRTQ